MHYSQFVTLCGLSVLQLVSAHSADAATPSGIPQAPRLSGHHGHNRMAKGKGYSQGQHQIGTGAANRKFQHPTTLATIGRKNMTASVAPQIAVAVITINPAAAVSTIIQVVTPVPVASPVEQPAAAPAVPSSATASPAAQAAAPSVAVAPQVVQAAVKSAKRKSTAPAAAVAAAPAPSAGASTSGASVATGGLTSAQVLAVMPGSSSCAGGPAAECLTAVQAAPLLAASFSKYGINNPGAQAAILALIGVESGDLKYNQHYNGGSPALTGQGTFNEMSPSFVLQYGKALGIAGTSALTVMQSINKTPADSIASAAWFMKTFCASVIPQFATSPDAAYTAYITGGSCIGTTMSGDRSAYFTKAKAALGV